ncbi:MAG: DNA repair protein RadC [Halioglobus sp.]
MSFIQDSGGMYLVSEPVTEEQIIQQASDILNGRLLSTDVLSSPAITRQFLLTKLAPYNREVFAVLFLTAQHQVIKYEEMFQGTLDGAAVYPREIVKRALELNAAAVILSHQHPSGKPEPSAADRRITERIVSAMSLVDIRVLDHIVVGCTDTYSFAEHGLL